MSYVIAYTTMDDPAAADSLSNKIVENRLGACVQIQSIESVYRWKGEIIKSDEFVLSIKTVSTKIDELEKFIMKNHPYEVPEFVVVPITHGFAPYLKWMRDNT